MPDKKDKKEKKVLSKESQEGLKQPDQLSQVEQEQKKEHSETQTVSQYEKKGSQTEEELQQVADQAQTPPDDQAPSKSKTVLEIEHILAEDLEDLYFSLEESQQKLLKEEGEKTAVEISQVIEKGKSVAVKVFELIKRWLLLIPGVNKFFIEQEAKIKTNKILKLKE